MFISSYSYLIEWSSFQTGNSLLFIILSVNFKCIVIFCSRFSQNHWWLREILILNLHKRMANVTWTKQNKKLYSEKWRMCMWMYETKQDDGGRKINARKYKCDEIIRLIHSKVLLFTLFNRLFSLSISVDHVHKIHTVHTAIYSIAMNGRSLCTIISSIICMPFFSSSLQ